MQDKLRAYMDHLFANTQPTKAAVELKEEMLQNLTDKYNDLLAEGKTPEAAFNIATASIGDISELLEQLRREETHAPRYSEDQIQRSGVEEFKEWKSESAERKKTIKSINNAIGTIFLVLYFIISFSTGAWYITWLIFLISGAVQNVVKACFDLKQ